MHLLAVHLFDFADQNPADEPVQHRLVQFFDGGIAPDFLDKSADFAFLCIRPALHHRQIMQALLVGFLLLFQRPALAPQINDLLIQGRQSIIECLAMQTGNNFLLRVVLV